MLTENLIKQKLASLNESQNSIETISQWIIFHRKSANLIVDLWTKEVMASDPKRKLTLFYLANDVMQNSRRKYGTELVEPFGKIMYNLFKDCWDKAGDLKLKYIRLLDIWKERNVFDFNFIAKIKSACNIPESGQKSNTVLPQPVTNDPLSLRLLNLKRRSDVLQPLVYQLKEKNNSNIPSADLEKGISNLSEYLKESKDLRETLLNYVQDIDKNTILYTSLLQTSNQLLENKKTAAVDTTQYLDTLPAPDLSRDPRRKRPFEEEQVHQTKGQEMHKIEDGEEEYDPFA